MLLITVANELHDVKAELLLSNLKPSANDGNAETCLFDFTKKQLNVSFGVGPDSHIVPACSDSGHEGHFGW